MKRAVLFGAGNNIKNILKYVDLRHIKIIAIVDNDPDKYGMRIGNIKVFKPNILKRIDFDVVLITSFLYYQEIKKQLERMKIKNICPIYSFQLEKKEKQIFDSSINLYGRVVLWYKKVCAKQEFYPSLFGIIMNPYFFARKGLLKSISENRQYIHGRCLDFGCGTKPYEPLFNVKEYIGVEIESEDRNPGLVYYDGRTLPFEDNYFDCIISSQVFEHIPNLNEIVVELYRVLKPGGYILLTVPFVYPEHLKPYDFRRYTSNGIQRLMEINGFYMVKSSKSGNFVEAVTQMKNVYFNEKMFSDKKNLNILKRIGSGWINLKGAILTKVLKNDQDLYLDNIIVAKKR